MRGEAQARTCVRVCMCARRHPQGHPEGQGWHLWGSEWLGRKDSWRGCTRAQAQVWVRDVCAWCPRSQPEACAGRMEDVLDELLQHREPRALRECLRKVRALGQGGLQGGDLLTAPGGPLLLGGSQCSHL